MRRLFPYTPHPTPYILFMSIEVIKLLPPRALRLVYWDLSVMHLKLEDDDIDEDLLRRLQAATLDAERTVPYSSPIFSFNLPATADVVKALADRKTRNLQVVELVKFQEWSDGVCHFKSNDRYWVGIKYSQLSSLRPKARCMKGQDWTVCVAGDLYLVAEMDRAMLSPSVLRPDWLSCTDLLTVISFLHLERYFRECFTSTVARVEQNSCWYSGHWKEWKPENWHHLIDSYVEAMGDRTSSFLEVLKITEDEYKILLDRIQSKRNELAQDRLRKAVANQQELATNILQRHYLPQRLKKLADEYDVAYNRNTAKKTLIRWLVKNDRVCRHILDFD